MKLEIKEATMKKKILELLRFNTEGLTITEISKKLGIHHTTASKYLAVIEAEGKLECRNIGMAKLFKIKPNGERYDEV